MAPTPDQPQLRTNIASTEFLTDEERKSSESYRVMKRNTAETVWSPRQRCNIPLPSPKWSCLEEEAITLLIRDGVKFKKSWAVYLKHSLLNRSEAATSGQYYLLKKRDVEMDALHNEKYWTYSTSANSHLPNMERVIIILRKLRSENLVIPMQISTCQSDEEYFRTLDRKRSRGSMTTDDESSDDADTKTDVDSLSEQGQGRERRQRQGQASVQIEVKSEELSSASSSPEQSPRFAHMYVGTLELSALFRARATGQTFVTASGVKYN